MAGYIGPAPVPQAVYRREDFTATASQTTFNTSGYTVGYARVYQNGVLLDPSDYTASNGSDVVLGTGATASDIVTVEAYVPFEVADQTFTGTTTIPALTMTGDITMGSGNGIDFSATSDAGGMTSELLDDYEEGTWTPVYSDGTNSGTGGLISGHYTKVGDIVHVIGRRSITSLNSMSGTVRITGLPFTAQNVVGLSVGPPVTIGRSTGLAITAGHTVAGQIVNNSTYALLALWDYSQGTSGFTAAELSDNGDMCFSITYKV